MIGPGAGRVAGRGLRRFPSAGWRPSGAGWDGAGRAAARAAQRLGVDLTVHLGDITLDGQNHPDDLGFAASRLRHWPTELLTVPGNHDLGDGSGEQPPVPARLAACREAFGAGRWARDLGRRRLVGVNAQLFGTGGDEEQAQWRWLAQQVAPGRSLALCLHRPLHRPLPAEAGRPGRYVPAEAADRLLGAPWQPGLKLVISGPTHQALDRQAGGCRHLWVPLCAFVLPVALQARIGEPQVGLGLLDLAGAEPVVDRWCPDGMLPHTWPAVGPGEPPGSVRID